MEREDRSVWLREKSDQITFANELKALAELPVFKKIIDGMIEKKLELLKIIDNQKSTKEQVDDARMKRMAIQWFIESIATTIYTGDRASEEIRRYEEHEAKKQGGG